MSYTDRYDELADDINVLPPGRYRSLALTALEESHLWLAEALAQTPATTNDLKENA